MTYTLENGEAPLRAEVVDKTIKGFAENSYTFKQAVTVTTTNAWKNVYYRENPSALTAPSTNAFSGLSRGANFPQATPTWEKAENWISKYGAEDNIFWEDILTNDIDIQARVLFRIAEAVVKQVDTDIWNGLTENLTPVNIQTFTITNTYDWGRASSAVIDDLMHAKQLISEYNYPTNNLMCFISPLDHRSIVNYLASKGAQFPTVGEDMATNGKVGKIAGIQLIESNNVSASNALVVVPKLCATWREAVSLSTQTITDPYKSVLIRAVEMGTLQLTDPKAVVLIRGTQD